MGGRLLVLAACALLGARATDPAPSASLVKSDRSAAPRQLVVTGATATGASAMTTVEARAETTDAAPQKVSIYVPLGYRVNLTHAPGTQIGVVTGSLQALQISRDAIIDVEGGTLLTDTPSKYVGDPCSPGPHAAVWLLHMMVPAATLDIPVYVDPTSGAEAAFSSAKLVLCLANPYEQAVPGTRAPFGVKIVEAKLALSAGIFTNPTLPGTYLWRSLMTPWTANGATPNALGTIETQSTVTIPSALVLKAKVRTIRHRRRGRRTVTNSVLLSGKLLENFQGVGGARVAFFASSKSAGTATTGAGGSFTKRTMLRKKISFAATATVPTRDISCVSPLPATWAPAGCASATIAGYRIRSNSIAAAPRKR